MGSDAEQPNGDRPRSATSKATTQRRRKGILLGLLLIAGAAGLVVTFRPLPYDHHRSAAKARMFLDQGRPDLAIAEVSHVRDAAPGAGDAMLVAGKAFLMMNDFTRARLALERSLAVDPEKTESAQILAALCLRTSDAKRALKYLRIAADADPTNARSQRAMGIVHHELGELPEAADAFAKALELDPNDWQVLIVYIAVLLDLQRPDAAAEQLNRALVLRPDDPMVWGLSARVAWLQGKPDKALAEVKRTLAADPRNLDALTVRSQSHRQARNWVAARADLDAILRVDSENLGAMQALAQIARSEGKTEEARQWSQRYQDTRTRRERMEAIVEEITQHPDDAEPRFRLGELARASQYWVLAKESYGAALDINPKHAGARNALNELLTNPVSRSALADSANASAGINSGQSQSKGIWKRLEAASYPSVPTPGALK